MRSRAPDTQTCWCTIPPRQEATECHQSGGLGADSEALWIDPTVRVALQLRVLQPSVCIQVQFNMPTLSYRVVVFIDLFERNSAVVQGMSIGGIHGQHSVVILNRLHKLALNHVHNYTRSVC